MALIPLDELQCSSGARVPEESRDVDSLTPSTAISYDIARDVLTFDGVRFSGEFMRQFVNPTPGWFRVEKRASDGVVLVHWKPETH